ncbi:MAG: hypothetical protein ACOCZV_00565 [Nanoarchaeota archaeon]
MTFRASFADELAGETIMAKELGVCIICKQTRLLNFAGLCKRCNKTGKGVAYVKKAINQHKKELEAQADQQGEMEEALQELNALEAKEELTSDEKERLEELKIETKQYREKQEEESDETEEQKEPAEKEKQES